MADALPLSLFDYELPDELIAQEPAEPRDASRLLVLPRRSGSMQHRIFRELPELLCPGDLLVVNRTRVIPARLRLRTAGGGKVELLLCRPAVGELHDAKVWRALGRPGSALRPGRELFAPDGSVVGVEARDGAEVTVRSDAPLYGLLERFGEVPLPPYIERPEGARAADARDYQTVFAQTPGAVAAPTASLHFTERVLEALRLVGVELAELVLHVGPGTFLPVRDEHADDVRRHPMHPEWYEVPKATQDAVARVRAGGARVVAVGTTCVRALETWHQTGCPAGESRLFIYPGFVFGVVDAMLTNFHLPRSTLLMLVSAFAGRERVLEAYAEAVRLRYRFFSYGDAMLIS